MSNHFTLEKNTFIIHPPHPLNESLSTRPCVFTRVIEKRKNLQTSLVIDFVRYL